jgi:hypothetical protein
MESSYFNLNVTPSFEPIFPEIASFNDCFSIHFLYNHSSISSMSSDLENPIFDYTLPMINNYFFIPHEVLCNYNRHTIMDSIDNTRFHEVPNDVLPEVLHQMGDCARNMVSLNTEGCGMRLHMNVQLHIVTRYHQFDPNCIGRQNVGFSPRLDVETTSNSTDQCSICLEEFCNGSQSELFYTRCSHIFHKECLTKWVDQCINRSSSYSCPLCRRDMRYYE